MTLLDDAPGQGTDTAPPAPAFDLSAFTAVSQGRPSPLAHVKEPDGGFWRKGPSGPPLVSCPEGTITKSGGRKGEVRLVQYGSAANFAQLILDTHDAEAQECREVVFGLGSNPRLMRDAVTFAARTDIDERSGKNDGNILVSAIRKHARESMAMLPEDAMYNEMRLATLERRDWLLRTLAGIADGAVTEQDSELYQRFGLDVAEPAPSVVYDRASKLAEGIAEKHAVHLWDHRKIMQGIAASAELAARARALGADPRIGEPLWNAEADSIAAAARLVAKANRASSQGTHAHALTEMADLERDWIQMAKDGEDLGVPVSVAKALVDAWEEMCAKFGLLQMQVEARVVNDRYRVAGSADRFTLCTRELRFPMLDGTERVIPAGTVVVGDLKGMPLDTKLPTPDGWTTIGDVQPGDMVIGSDGNPCRVVGKSELRNRPCYMLTLSDGSTVVADDEHRWAVETGVGCADRWKRQVLTTKELAGSVFHETASGRKHRQHRILDAAPLNLPDVDLPIDPYVLGAWLGDGKHTSGEITQNRGSSVWAEIERRGYRTGKPYFDKRNNCESRSVLGLRPTLREVGILGAKQIPVAYLRASYRQRLDLLRGLMDTDGTWNTPRRAAMFCTVKKALAEQVRELITSLGQHALLSEVKSHGFGKPVTSYHVKWAPLHDIPFLMPDKVAKATARNTGRNAVRWIVSVDEVPSVPTQCIAVDSPDHTYLCGESMIVTHNTGTMKVDRRGYPAYWQNYSIQFSVYGVSSRPYNPDTGERGEWPWPVSDEHALLFHLDVLGALEGRPSCVPYYVDLKIGREAADLVVAAKEFAERTDVISLAPISGWTESPVLSGGMSATLFDSTTVAPELEREQVRARLNALRVNHPDSMRALAASWPAGVPTKFDGHLHTVAELAAIDVVLAPLEQAAASSTVLDGPGRAKAKAGWLAEIQSTVAASPAPVPAVEVSVPVPVPVSGVAFDAFLPDEGGQVDPASFDTLVDRYKALPDTARAWMGQFILDAANAGVSFRPREFGMPEGTWVSTVRRFEIMRGLVLTAESEMASARMRGDTDPFDQSLTDVVGICVASACDAVMPVSVGAALGALTGEQAKVFAVCAAGLADGTASVSFPHGADSPRVTPTAV